MPHGKLPSKSLKKKRSKLDEIIDAIVTYMEVANAGAGYLAQKKMLSPQLDFKIGVQVEFCGTLLVNIIEIDKAYLQWAIKQCREHPEFKNEVEKFAKNLVPGSSKKFHLYSSTDLTLAKQEEMSKKEAMKKIRGGGLIIR